VKPTLLRLIKISKAVFFYDFHKLFCERFQDEIDIYLNKFVVVHLIVISHSRLQSFRENILKHQTIKALIVSKETHPDVGHY
jgi:hypothetical protein